MEQALQLFDTNVYFPLPVTWAYSRPGFYIHRSRVYLTGEIANYGIPFGPTPLTVGTLIYRNLPELIRPAEDVHLTFVADHDRTTDPATPGIDVPYLFPATLRPDGSLSLDSLPPYINAAPPNPPYGNIAINTSHVGPLNADFPQPLSYAIVLGNASWPLASGSQFDEWTSEPLGPYLDANWVEDIDSRIHVHGARVHLSGRVRCIEDEPASIATGLPGKYGFDVADSGVDFGLRYDFTVANGPEFPVALKVQKQLFLSGGPVAIEGDLGRFETPQHPPLDWARGVLEPNGGDGRPAYFGDFYGGNGSYESRIYGVVCHPVPSVTFTPPGGRLTSEFVGEASVSWNHGGSKGPSGVASVDVGAQIAHFFPEPDWVAVAFVLGGDPGTSAVGDPTGPFPDGGPPVDETDPPLELAWSIDPCVMCYRYFAVPEFVNVLVENAPNPFFLLADNDGLGNLVWDLPVSYSGGSAFPLDGFLQRPDGEMLYQRDPYNKASTLLWKPNEIEGLVMTARLTGDTYRGSIDFGVSIIPYYETADKILKRGDILDLTGAGWQSKPTLINGTVDAASGRPGIRRRGRILGQRPRVKADPNA